ncbi:MAG TPA: FAD-dependent oxidoreductase [Flavipsychrobacter sp.]|nr:FAD-dependent oxidoreductase [Flavipsychrobacter sp.]
MKNFKSSLLGRLIHLIHQEINLSNSKRTSFSPSRRKFIGNSSKAAAGIAVGLTVPSFLSSCGTSTPKQDIEDSLLEVAILGAGMAGLNCANHLLSSGIRFKIFDADRRCGGRILTHYNDALQLGIFPELGGDFIDSNHKDMIALAKEFQLDLLDLIAEQEKEGWVKDIYYFDNRNISEKEIIKEFKKIAPKLVSDIDALGENYDTPEAETLDNMPLSNYIQQLHCAKWLKDLLDAAFVAEYGLDTNEQSTLNLLSIIDPNTDEGFKVFGSSDERFRIKGGNSKLIEALVDKVGKENISLNHEVMAIDELEDGSYNISFKNKEVVRAKTIVCTIPFTILRTISLNLKDLSANKRKCIDELGYGNNTKLVLGYKGQPWRNKKNNAMGYVFTKDMVNGWDGTSNTSDNNTNGAYVAYFGGTFSKNLAVVSFKNPLAPPTHVWRTELPKEQVTERVNQLGAIFKQSKEQFLDKHVFVNWIDYPFVKASYSCYKPGQWTTIAGLEMLPVGNCYFAGEHCSEQFQGFMNGAAETGRHVAEVLMMKATTPSSSPNEVRR